MAEAGTMVGNAVFILTSDVVNRAATFVLYALIARHLGATEVGQWALALALFYTFQVFAAGGLKTVITREVAKDARATSRHLVSGTILVTFASAVSIAALAGFVRVMGYARDTAAIILLLGLGLLPYALSAVCEAVFQATDKMRYITYAQVPVHIAKVGFAYLLLHHGYGVYHLAVLMLACHGTVALGEWWLMLRRVTRPRVERRERCASTLKRVAASSFALARSAATFLGIDGLTAITSSLNIVLLSALEGERQVGLYSVASQLMIPITLVYQSVVTSVFPTLCRTFDSGTQDVADVLARMLALLLALAIPVAVGLFFLADSALQVLYGGRDFLEASAPLRVMVWIIVPAALTAVLGQVFLAGFRERVTLRIVAVDLLVGLVAGVILIANFGLIGAAAAAVLTKAVDLWQHYWPVSRLVPAISLREVGWKPLVAGICMAVYLAAAAGQPLALTVTCAGALYLGVMLALTIWTGGSRQVGATMPHLWRGPVSTRALNGASAKGSGPTLSPQPGVESRT
jgi:O-antigen/teichoic acid export membrane protein